MAFTRHSRRSADTNIWPGFVDAMTALLLIIVFVLSIFMIVQFVLRDQLSGASQELDRISKELNLVSEALGASQGENEDLENQLTKLRGETASLEEQVASLIARNTKLEDTVLINQEKLDKQVSANDALSLALSQTQENLDAETAAKRLAEAKREALDALIEKLRQEQGDKNAELQGQISEMQSELDTAEAERLAEAMAAEELRKRLENSNAELTAMTLSLEAERQKAEETLTLLAAAQAAGGDAKEKANLLDIARQELSQKDEQTIEQQKKIALLNAQTADLRQQLNKLQGLLDDAQDKELAATVEIETLGQNLNQALAQLAEKEKLERERLEEEANSLRRYRSEFFGQLRDIIGNRDDIRVVGDRFVFSSEVLFDSGSASLGVGGREQIRQVGTSMLEVARNIPPEIDWILRVDGHTDVTPLSGSGRYKDNWELSQARALSVVEFLINEVGIPATRLAATGFGEYQPISTSDLAQNRRIEFKLTEK